MSLTAESAREKSEARRLRILSSAATRLDVVSGLSNSDCSHVRRRRHRSTPHGPPADFTDTPTDDTADGASAATSKVEEATDTTKDTAESPSKSYLGVARTRRRLRKEQKARLTTDQVSMDVAPIRDVAAMSIAHRLATLALLLGAGWMGGRGDISRVECSLTRPWSWTRVVPMELKDAVRPRGVVVDEFELEEEPGGNIDPMFRVDLDLLLDSTNLPPGMEGAARVSIGLHRRMMYYLWTLPVAIVWKLVELPGMVMRGLVNTPPVVLAVSLAVRVVNGVFVGGKREAGGPVRMGKNLDVLATIMDTAKNYVAGSLPRTVFVLGTLYDVIRIDMYVVLCGLLVGLVAPWNDFSGGIGGRDLGEGEL